MKWRAAWCLLLSAPLLGSNCGDSGPSGGGGPRTFAMGFSALPPRQDTALVLPVLTLAGPHSDAGLVQLSIPWSVLLSGFSAPLEVRAVRLPLADYYRRSGRMVVVALDVTNGLDRSAEDPALVAAGKSITDTMIQRLYRDYVSAVDSILHPEYLSLAAETNLIRAAAAAPVYAAVVTMTNAAAAHERGLGTTSKLLVSVQVETAWGKLQQNGAYVGIAQDRADFPFLDALGLSSYPYLGGFLQPEDVPLDYYARLVNGSPLPELVLEGGWPSASVSGVFLSDSQLQARYIHHQARLLDSARAVGLFQITFTDLDLIANRPPAGSILPLFASLGLVDTALRAKLALAAWDTIYHRPYRP